MSAMEDYPRALMRAMEENSPNARWDFAKRNYLTDLECPPEEMNAIHQYGIELQRRAWEQVAQWQDAQENTANVSYIQVEGRAVRVGAQAKESSVPPSGRTSLFKRAPSEKSGELSMKLPKQRTEQEVIVHVQDEGQELVLMEEGRMGEHQNQVVVEQEKGKRVDPESSPSPPQQHSPAQQHWRQQEMVVVVEEEDGSDVEEQKAVVEEQGEKGEGQQPVVIRQEQKEMGKPADAQVSPLPRPAPAPPPQQEHAQAHQQQSESPPPPPPQQQQQQRQQLPVKAPLPPPPPLPPEISMAVDGSLRG